MADTDTITTDAPTEEGFDASRLSKPTVVTFMTQGTNTVLERIPPEEEFPKAGGVREVRGSGLKYIFKPAGGAFSRLDLEPGQDTLPIYPSRGDSPTLDAVEWVRQHELFGERIWEVDPTVPEPADVLAELSRLAVAQDETAIAEILDAEQHGWERPIVVDTATNLLRALEGAQALPTDG